MKAKSQTLNDNTQKKIWEVQSTDKYLSEETIKKAIEEHKDAIESWAYIHHDKDLLSENDYKVKEGKAKVGDLKTPHWHIELKFNCPKRRKEVANLFGIANANYIWPATSSEPKYKYEAMLCYLTHFNAKDKAQYDNSLVKCSLKDYDTYEAVLKAYEERVINKEPKKESTKKRRTDQEVDDLINEIGAEIMSGKMTRYNINDYKKEGKIIDTRTYVNYKKYIDDFFLQYEKEKAKSKEKTNKPTFVYYLQGDAGCGKTTYAKRIAKELGYRQEDIFISNASEDILGDYLGQPVIILDDFRASNMQMSYVLKLLDNNTACSVKSRYYDKTNLAEVIIITTVIRLEKFYNSFSEHTEPKEQLMRRITYLYEFCSLYDTDFPESPQVIMKYTYDKESKQFTHFITIPNPLENYLKDLKIKLETSLEPKDIYTLAQFDFYIQFINNPNFIKEVKECNFGILPKIILTNEQIENIESSRDLNEYELFCKRYLQEESFDIDNIESSKAVNKIIETNDDCPFDMDTIESSKAVNETIETNKDIFEELLKEPEEVDYSTDIKNISGNDGELNWE